MGRSMDHSLRLDGLPPSDRRPAAPHFWDLPERTVKPRRTGLTHVLDRGLSVRALESLLETAGAHIDLLKLGWGTAYVSGGVRDKVALWREDGVRVWPGGASVEIALPQ